MKARIEAPTARLHGRERVGGFDDALTKLVAGNVCQQIDHRRGHPGVAKELEAAMLRLQGWVYDFEGGEVDACDENENFSKI